ncbi:MAG: hypothetical protein A2Y33_10955 [Spirochaetes bacterium GWF1_51_8]|nr:MAG: hypothetical protein A2Y33_10955 [Spirochaetes bacterium GWF1_51_8]
MKSKILIVFLIQLLTFSIGFGLTKEKKITQSIDVIATGGAGVADAGRFGLIFMNPAALGINEMKGFSILKVGARANIDSYDLAMLGLKIANGEVSLETMTSDQWQMILDLRSTIGVTGPLMLGYMGSGLGLLLYDDILTSVTVKPSPGIPYVDFETYADIGFIVGYGFELPIPFFLGKFTRVYGGINLKYLNRMKYVDPRMSLLEALDMGAGIAAFQKGFLMGQNISSDVGVIINSPEFAFGFVVHDWFSTGFNWSEYVLKQGSFGFEKLTNSAVYETTYFTPALDVGINWMLPISGFLLSKMEIYFDVVNALDFTESYLLKFRLGIQARLFQFLDVRAGLYKGYPTLGLGFDLPLIKINAAYYVEELGTLPGTIPQQNVMFDIQLML